MIPIRLVPVTLKQLWRHRTRTALTVGGVAIAMFLFVAVQSLQRGVREATDASAADQMLIVYRQNRFCPAASRLPEYYLSRMERIEGVERAIPMKVVVNNCRASLDVTTFRGLPEKDLALLSGAWTVLEGDLATWSTRSDAAILGEALARRRRMKVGDSFTSSGVNVSVAAIIRSTQSQDQNVAYVHLNFLQQATRGAGLGVVTQFAVKVSDPSRLEAIAQAIDDEFRSDPDPTTTRPEKAFVAQAAQDIVEVVGFTKYLGWGCVLAVLALVGNAIVLSVRDRVREHAVLQTLGFRGGLLARMIVAEGVLIGLAGGALGAAIAGLVVWYGRFSISAEGQSMTIELRWAVLLTGLAVAMGVGVVAGLVPALRASRREIASCFRAA
ncbi:MAG: ABC transporter permease [Phycisphaerales bacterium]|nr:ABC transporter permease [Phycisphaerales bacterium]